MSASPKKLKAAVKLARKGETKAALASLTALAGHGDGAAAASLVEILAFQDRWIDLLPYAMQFLTNPDVAHSSNVFEGIAGLVRCASQILGEPNIIKKAAKVVPSSHAALKRSALLRDPKAYQGEMTGSLGARRRHYDRAVTETAVSEFATRIEYEQELFAFASTYGIEEELIRRWNRVKPDATFDDARPVARALAKRGEGDRAWKVIASKVSEWYAVDIPQVAPVELLFDPYLAPLMTPRRRGSILATPRSGET